MPRPSSPGPARDRQGKSERPGHAGGDLFLNGEGRSGMQWRAAGRTSVKDLIPTFSGPLRPLA